MHNIRAFVKSFSFTFLALTIIALSVMSVYAVDIDTVITPAVPIADKTVVEPPFLDSGVKQETITDDRTDNLPVVTSFEGDVNAIRQYIEFSLFVLLPLVLAIVVFLAFCYWFYKSFMDVL